MKVLVLNGSPKRTESDCLRLTEAFLAGMAQARPLQTQLVHVVDRRIGYCRGCFACMRNGGQCVQQDDMAPLLADILGSDVVVFSFPLYGYGMPAPLKALLDRTLPLGRMTMRRHGGRWAHEPQADFTHLRYVMICGCGFPNARGNFEAVEAQCRLMFGEKATLLTVPEAPLMHAPAAAPVAEPYLALMTQAGREYAAAGVISPATLARLAVPMLPEEVYAGCCQ